MADRYYCLGSMTYLEPPKYRFAAVSSKWCLNF